MAGNWAWQDFLNIKGHPHQSHNSFNKTTLPNPSDFSQTAYQLRTKNAHMSLGGRVSSFKPPKVACIYCDTQYLFLSLFEAFPLQEASNRAPPNFQGRYKKPEQALFMERVKEGQEEGIVLAIVIWDFFH